MTRTSKEQVINVIKSVQPDRAMIDFRQNIGGTTGSRSKNKSGPCIIIPAFQ